MTRSYETFRLFSTPTSFRNGVTGVANNAVAFAKRYCVGLVRYRPTFGTVSSACNADDVSETVLRFLIYAVAIGNRNAVPYHIPSNTDRTVSAPRMRTASMAASSERK